MDLDKLLELGIKYAEPYRKTNKILAFLLVIFVTSTIYLATTKINIEFVANNNDLSDITQTNGK